VKFKPKTPSGHSEQEFTIPHGVFETQKHRVEHDFYQGSVAVQVVLHDPPMSPRSVTLEIIHIPYGAVAFPGDSSDVLHVRSREFDIWYPSVSYQMTA
jgi:hypothetical protein